GKPGGTDDTAAAGAGPPLRGWERRVQMAVLGDSVLWGQGLRALPSDEKPAVKVRNWLAERLGTGVDLHLFAHSGAILGKEGDEPSDLDLPGELPRRAPTIHAQIELMTRQFTNPESVDLIVVNGGINDLSLPRI